MKKTTKLLIPGHKNSSIFRSVVITSVLSASGYSFAQQLDLANEPLFLGAGVDPNILMVIDDSGSMAYTESLSAEATAAFPREFLAKVLDEHDEVVREFEELIDYTPDTAVEAFRLCAGFNVLAFNPEITYTPWDGENITQTPYASANLTTAMINPYLGPAGNNLTDISDHVFTVWNDNNSNDAFDLGECPSLGLPDHDYTPIDTCIRFRNDGSCAVEIPKVTVTEGNFTAATCDNTSSCVRVTQLSPAERINYANWYSYYRMRDFVSKKAMLQLISDSNVRMGMGTLHDNNDVGRPVDNMAVAVNKLNLMDSVSRIRPAGGTPSREALNNAGEYYANGSSDLFGGRATSSPILSAEEGGQCQKNFTVLMTDGFTRGGSAGIANRDIDGGAGANNSIFDGGLYDDNVSDTLADVAMKFFEEDLAPDLEDKVRMTGAELRLTDPQGLADADTIEIHQHMITYTAAFVIDGFMTCDPADDGSCDEDWPEAINYSNGTDPATIDDLRHAAYNGRGEFISAQTPEELIEGLENAIDNISGGSAAAAVASNSTSLLTNSFIYQGEFDSADWSGNLSALPVNSGSNPDTDGCAGLNIGEVCSNPAWQAADLLDDRTANSRVILTIGSDGAGIPFRWPGDESAQQTANLVAGLRQGGVSSADAENILEYLRGDQSLEAAGVFRDRSTILGDIVHSSPSFVGAPRFAYPDDLEAAAYSDFASAQSARDQIVYVGANDGMLHGFDAATGEERIAYVPNAVLGQIAQLADVNYQHEYYVDGSPTTGDAFIDGAWRSVLAGSLRAGGRSVFALDITNPAGFSENNADDIVLWEFAHPDLGFTFSQPDIVKTNNGEWSVIFGSGYNKISNDGVAHLFVVNASNADINVPNTFEAIAAGDVVAGLANGLATVTPVDIDGDIDVDYVYAGDLLGNLWRFDLTDPEPSRWSSTKIFTARSPDNAVQRITTRPSVAFHPDGQEGFLVMFGTGSYIENSDNASIDQETQTFYAVWDKLEDSPTPVNVNRNDTPEAADYVEQSIIAEFNGLRVTSDNTVDWDRQFGWYMDLVVDGADNQGERQVTNSVIRSDRIVFTTLAPETEICEAGGNSYLMELTLEHGGRPGDSVLDINGDGVINDADLTGANGDAVVTGFLIEGLISEPTILGSADQQVEHKIFSSSTGSTESILESAESADSEGSRQSWTEIIQ